MEYLRNELSSLDFRPHQRLLSHYRSWNLNKQNLGCGIPVFASKSILNIKFNNNNRFNKNSCVRWIINNNSIIRCEEFIIKLHLFKWDTYIELHLDIYPIWHVQRSYANGMFFCLWIIIIGRQRLDEYQTPHTCVSAKSYRLSVIDGPKAAMKNNDRIIILDVKLDFFNWFRI